MKTCLSYLIECHPSSNIQDFEERESFVFELMVSGWNRDFSIVGSRWDGVSKKKIDWLKHKKLWLAGFRPNSIWCNILEPHLVQHLDPYEDLAFHEGPMYPRNHQSVANVHSLDIPIEFCSNKAVSMLCLARKPMTRPSREDSQISWSISDFWGSATKFSPVLEFYYFWETDWSDLEAGNCSH